MATSITPGSNAPEADLQPEAYTSEILQHLIEPITRLKDGRVLDMGPVCEENIMFFAGRLQKHYVCDMFLRLIREQRVARHSRNVWRHLDYPPRFFDGIHIWDFCDHLDDKKVGQLMKHCLAMLQPGGLLLMTAFEKTPPQGRINAFIIQPGYRISYRVQPHLNLPWHCRHNRALMSLLTGFSIVKTLRYRNGIREILLKKPLSIS
ncbi:MAG: class I SAM-dependent methyltransferase [Deltaproteobacteria bacterium]|nr:class I SAM-dependent methyltransferase [Deltaproteobacteria bacterium]MBW2482560.1 class I SAM-dependent methyltransferase [Deltaproteobacteria bacterium]